MSASLVEDRAAGPQRRPASRGETWLVAAMSGLTLLAIGHGPHWPAPDPRWQEARFTEQLLRSAIRKYALEHQGRHPSASLAELVTTTSVAGEIGWGPAFGCGPYLHEVPRNPFNGSHRVADQARGSARRASHSVDGSPVGWWYDPVEGSCRLNAPTRWR